MRLIVKDAGDIFVENRMIQATTLEFSTCENIRCQNHVQEIVLMQHQNRNSIFIQLQYNLHEQYN